jgi:hypothetical protein
MSFDDWPAWDGVRPLDWYQLIHQAETIRAPTPNSEGARRDPPLRPGHPHLAGHPEPEP